MTYTNILIIKIRAMGDTLLATPSIAAVRQTYPNAKITALVSPVGYEILENNPDLDQVQVFDKSMKFLSYLKFLKSIRAAHYDLLINLHATFRTALIAKISGCKSRIVHNHSGRNFFSTIPISAKKEAKSSIERDLDAVRSLNIKPKLSSTKLTINHQDTQVALEFIEAHQLNQAKGFMIIAPGAGKTEKRWPIEQVTAFLNLAHIKTKYSWVLLVGPDEQELAKKVMRANDNHALIIFEGSLKSAAALIEQAKGMITTDSGPKHIACAVGTSTLTLWTNEPIAEWHPYDQNRHKVLLSPTGQVADLVPELVLEKAIEYFPGLA